MIINEGDPVVETVAATWCDCSIYVRVYNLQKAQSASSAVQLESCLFDFCQCAGLTELYSACGAIDVQNLAISNHSFEALHVYVPYFLMKCVDVNCNESRLQGIMG